MKVSYNFLKNWIGFSERPQEIAELINLHITEVERIISSSRYQNIVVGEILEISPHPHADKLQLVKVNIGDKILNIVCGASNIAVGQKVPVALEGCVLPGGLEIRSTTIRGERSLGMLCSRAELGLEKESEGIWILDTALETGTSLGEVMGEDSDTIFDLKVLSNRPDYLSYLSIAREIAAVLKKDFAPDIKYDFNESKEKAAEIISVTVQDSALCPRYIGRVIKNIAVKESPAWMQQVLLASDLRPINNIVDISNYVLLELGQPTHAFDLSKVTVGKIIVRRAKAGETLRGLDDKTHKLVSPMLVIADAKRPLAIAGIVGGEDSSVTEKTTDILLESANFNMTSIRKTSRLLGIHTDSSARFERGLSVLLPEIAIQRMAHLIQEQCPDCQVLQGAVDVHEKLPEATREIKVDPVQIDRLAGVDIPIGEMADILTRLDLPTQIRDGQLAVLVPHYRQDIIQTADITEEVVRIYGIDKIPYTMPQILVALPEIQYSRLAVRQIKEILARLGFNEVYLQPFDGGSPQAVKLENPLVSYLTHLKTDLSTDFKNIEVISNGGRAERFKIFELDTIFIDKGDVLPRESQQLVGRIRAEAAYRQVRGTVDVLLRELGVSVGYREVQGINGLRLLVGEQQIGEIIQTSPQDAYFTLQIDLLIADLHLVRSLKPLPKFPPIKFDMAFVVHPRVRVGDLLDSVRSADILIDQVELFDVHSLGKEGKNVAFHIEIRSSSRTLTSDDREYVEGRVKNELQERYKAKLRGS